MKKLKLLIICLPIVAFILFSSASACGGDDTPSGGGPVGTPFSGQYGLKTITIGRLDQTPRVSDPNGTGSFNRLRATNGCSTTLLYGSLNIVDIMSNGLQISQCEPNTLHNYNGYFYTKTCWVGNIVAESLDKKVIYKQTIDLSTCSIDANIGVIYVNLPKGLALKLSLFLYEPCLQSSCYSNESSSRGILWKFPDDNKLEITTNENEAATNALRPEGTNERCN